MKRIFLLSLSILLAWHSGWAQHCCLTNSLIINTGYNPVTNTAIAGGADGAKAVPDPFWKLSVVTPSVAPAILATPIPGLVEVIPGNNADIIIPVSGWSASWPTSGWISCLNSSQYITDGTGVTPYEMTLSRSFRLCSDDSVVLDMYVADDNYVVASDVDGVSLGFSQPPFPITTIYFTTYAHVTKTLFLTAGTHTLSINVGNINVTSVSYNPTGLNVHGTVSSQSAANTLVSEKDPTCGTYSCSSVPTNSTDKITLADTLKPCEDSTVLLNASVTGVDTVRSYTWSPITGLSSSTIEKPILTATASGWYYLTVKTLINYNLVTNGDFECGNYGFSSSYTYDTPPEPLLLEDHYSVDTDPHDVHSGFTKFGDHTTGTGEMMIINGGAFASDIWCQTIKVSPNTDYDFSAWFANASPAGPGTYPILQFRINGTLIGTPTTLSSGVGVWENFYTPWNSGTNTTATICIYDATTSTGGNDFVIDDIWFRKIAPLTDSVYISIIPPDTAYASKDTTACSAAAPITLNSVPGYFAYQWSTGVTTTSISVSTAGNYWVYNTNTCSNILIDTFHVKFITTPTVQLGNDTTFCTGKTLSLTDHQPKGYTYKWSTGSTDTSIIAATKGAYWLTVTDTGCSASDTINIKIAPIPVVDLGPDYLNCQGIADTLRATGIYEAPTYLWSDGNTSTKIAVTKTGKYWLQVTDNNCPGSDTMNAVILFDTLNFYNHDTAICRHGLVAIFATGDPGQTYQWLPTAGIATANTLAPVIMPDTSATYALTTSMEGCPDRIDSIHIDVQPNPSVFIGDNRVVCQFDSVHIIADVLPRWYKHYNYKWSPATSIDNTNTSAVTFTAGVYEQLMLTVSTPAGCWAKDSAEMVVRPGNFMKFDTSFNICPRDSVQFRPKGAIAYEWHPGVYLSDSFSATPWSKAITSQHYRVIGTSEYGCRDTATTWVTVRAGGVINMPNEMTLYPGESYHIAPQTNCVYLTWFPAQGLNNAEIADPVASPQVTTRYVVHAATEWGCPVTDSIDIIVNPETLLDLPNAFTPGTGANNTFKILKRGIATLKSFTIYNRWGNKVFETSNIEQGWDGTFNGKPQPFDVYVYEVEAVTNAGKDFVKHGNVTLLR